MFKTILVHVDQSACSARRIAVALRLALANDAHLIGAAMTGVPAYPLPGAGLASGGGLPYYPFAELRTEANRSLDLFEAAARRAGNISLERRCLDGDPGSGISVQARYCDLAIISQTARDHFLPRLRPDFPDYVVLESPRPVLVLPVGGQADPMFERITVAWNASPEAARSVASAVPLLQRASQVDLVVFDAGQDDLHGEEPGADLAAWLARHGVSVEVTNRAAELGEGQSLHAFAKEKKSDLIVMGAYGHSRFHELVLGGMTRDLLATSTIALWMAH